MMLECNFARGAVDIDAQETAFDPQKAMHVVVKLFTISAAMVIGARATGKFTGTRLRVDRGVLPVPVAADDIEVFLCCDELAKLVAFVGKAFVGVVVVLFQAVRAYYGSWREQYFESRIGCTDGIEKPLLLYCAPDALVRPVRHIVGTAVVTSFDQPDLQVLAPAEGAVGFFAHRYLFAERGEPLFPC